MLPWAVRTAAVACLLGAVAVAVAHAESLRWPDSVPPLARAWHPIDKMISQQNPPDFSWPAVPGATSYDLRISRDDAGKHVVHRIEGLPHNFHNFATTFDPDVYYWRLRFRSGDHTSVWSEPRRFRIDPDAWAFPVPPVGELLRRVPRDHPRVWVTQENREALRARAHGPGEAWFTSVLARVRREMETPRWRSASRWP